MVKSFLISLPLIVGIAFPVYSQVSCGSRDAIIESLREKYGEVLSGGGLQDGTSGRVLEIYFSPETGTWSILSSDANGMSCLLATGTNWHREESSSMISNIGILAGVFE